MSGVENFQQISRYCHRHYKVHCFGFAEISWNICVNISIFTVCLYISSIKGIQSFVQQPYFCLAYNAKRSSFDLETMPHSLFQIHLERIANFLICGEEVWWHHKKETNEIIFHDGDEDPNEHIEGPGLMGFTEFNMSSASKYVKEIWEK